MSVVTTAIIMHNLCEPNKHRLITHLHGVYGEHDEGYYHTPFRDMTDGAIKFCWGGTKMPECDLLVGAFNYLDHAVLVEVFLAWPWEYPENAVLVFQPQDGPTVVVRAAYKEAR